MYKVNDETEAKKLARKHSLAYGMYKDGSWYVGTTHQLQSIGVVIKESMELI